MYYVITDKKVLKNNLFLTTLKNIIHTELENLRSRNKRKKNSNIVQFPIRSITLNKI